MDGLCGFKRLRRRGCGTERESDHGADLHFAAAEDAGAEGDVARIHAHGGKLLLQGLMTKRPDFFDRRVRSQERVIDKGGERRSRRGCRRGDLIPESLRQCLRKDSVDGLFLHVDDDKGSIFARCATSHNITQSGRIPRPPPYYGKILPGFRIVEGSNAAFTLRMRSSSASVRAMPRYGLCE